MAEVESSQLPAIHGGLIAAGFLRFELLNREAGMGYRVSPQGRAALKSVERGETASIESNGTDAENNAEESRWADAA